MRVDVVETVEALEKLELSWQTVYEADAEAQFFLSWGWISQLLKDRRTGWCILAAKREDAGGEYVAFFPLRLGVRFSERRGMFVNEIEMAGSFGWADYTGFICRPEHEAEAIRALSSHLLEMRWAKLNLRHLRVSDQRFTLFMSAFDQDRFAIED